MIGISENHIIINIYEYYYLIRWNVSVDHDCRTATSMKECLESSSFGVVHPPLLNFDLDQLIIDELHMMLRVSDVLLRNLIWAMVSFDDEERRRRARPLSNFVRRTNQILWYQFQSKLTQLMTHTCIFYHMYNVLKGSYVHTYDNDHAGLACKRRSGRTTARQIRLDVITRE